MTKPNSSRSAIDIGTIVDDKYRIEALIGQGGMGSVFLASHARLPGKKVAIKVLHTGAEDADIVARFRREAEIAARLDHPNIVIVDDINVTKDGQPYLVLEYLQGVTLADRIAAGPLPIEQAMSIIRQVGSALAAAHREGIVHRDLKPQNIFLVQTDIGGKSVEVAKVLDFGISKIRGSQTVKTQETALLGTPQYMSPEQATGNHDSVDQRTDIFAMGAIVHEMLSGTPAFTGASIPEVVFKGRLRTSSSMPDTIPPEISGAVKKAMSKAQPERFPSMSSFVEALTGMPLASPRDIVPPSPPSTFAAGSKHTYNQAGAAHASTLASGDHAVSIVKALSSTQAAGGAGMASTALGVAVPKPAIANPVGLDVATVSTIVPNAQHSVQGVAAEARAGRVAADSRSIWSKVLLAAPVAAVAVLALVFFTGKKTQNAYDTATVHTGIVIAGSGGSTGSPPTPTTTPELPAEQTKNLVAPGAGSSIETVDPAKPDTTQRKVVLTPPIKASDKPGGDAKKPDGKVGKTPPPPPVTDEEGDEKLALLAGARRAEQEGNLDDAIRQATSVINSEDAPQGWIAKAHFMRARLKCLQHKTDDAQTDIGWLKNHGRPKQVDKLVEACSK